MFGGVVLAVLAIGFWMLPFGWMLRRLLKPARAIWHGETSHVARLITGRSMKVTPRSYFAFVLTMASFAVAMILMPLGMIGLEFTRNNLWLIPAEIAFLCICVMFCGILLHALINAFNRPRWLVAPPYRDEQGWATERRIRRQNLRSRPPY